MTDFLNLGDFHTNLLLVLCNFKIISSIFLKNRINFQINLSKLRKSAKMLWFSGFPEKIQWKCKVKFLLLYFLNWWTVPLNNTSILITNLLLRTEHCLRTLVKLFTFFWPKMTNVFMCKIIYYILQRNLFMLIDLPLLLKGILCFKSVSCS